MNHKILATSLLAGLLATGLAACGGAPTTSAPQAPAAQTTSEHGASLLVFPKIVADASADTVVQVTNLLESRVDVFCTYVAGDGTWASSGFTVSLIAYTPPGPPDQSNAGSISAHVSVTTTQTADLPEPSTMLLSGLGLTFLGGAAWRKRRAKVSA